VRKALSEGSGSKEAGSTVEFAWMTDPHSLRWPARAAKRAFSRQRIVRRLSRNCRSWRRQGPRGPWIVRPGKSGSRHRFGCAWFWRGRHGKAQPGLPGAGSTGGSSIGTPRVGSIWGGGGSPGWPPGGSPGTGVGCGGAGTGPDGGGSAGVGVVGSPGPAGFGAFAIRNERPAWLVVPQAVHGKCFTRAEQSGLVGPALTPFTRTPDQSSRSAGQCASVCIARGPFFQGSAEARYQPESLEQLGGLVVRGLVVTARDHHLHVIGEKNGWLPGGGMRGLTFLRAAQ
jgi:hypothetical protein